MRGVSLVSFSGTTESFSFFKKALAYYLTLNVHKAKARSALLKRQEQFFGL
jgi:hypothetical protein